MAQMIPETLFVKPESRAEEEFFLACKKQLGTEYVVFHSVYYLQPEGKNGLLMREGDFLIFDRKRGVLYAIEAKSGAIEYDGERGRWYQNGKELRKTPYEQASTFMNEIAAFIDAGMECRCPDPPNYVFGACFPDVRQVTKKLLCMDPRLTITSEQMNDLPAALNMLYTAMSRAKHVLAMIYCE